MGTLSPETQSETGVGGQSRPKTRNENRRKTGCQEHADRTLTVDDAANKLGGHEANTMPKIKVHHTNDIQEERKTSNRFTMKGRLEYAKDHKGVMWVALEVMGITEVKYGWMEDDAMTIGWEVGENGNITEERMEEVQKMVDKFIERIDEAKDARELIGQGIEMHVFKESLKALPEYDGERNGPLSNK